MFLLDMDIPTFLRDEQRIMTRPSPKNQMEDALLCLV